MNYLTIKTSGVRGYRLHVTKLYLYFKFILYHIMNQYHMVLFVLWLYHRIYCVMCYKSYVALIQYYRNSNIWKYLYQTKAMASTELNVSLLRPWVEISSGKSRSWIAFKTRFINHTNDIYFDISKPFLVIWFSHSKMFWICFRLCCLSKINICD